MLRFTRHRRAFLHGAGVLIALPTLESLTKGDLRTSQPPKRLICIGNEFGMYPGAFWPDATGSNYALTPLLQPLAPHRRDFTLFSQLDHGLSGGHFAVHTFLTGVKSADARGMDDGGISLDQRAAEHVGSQTRFRSLTVGSQDGLHGGPMMSWTRTGTRVPPVAGPREMFRMLFIDDNEQARQQEFERIALRESILDSVLDDARSLRKRVSQQDQNKLEEYFSSVRDVETKLTLDRQWQKVPKPTPPIDEPINEGLTKDLPKIYELLALALQTDSTRVATLEIGGSFAASDLGIKKGYHGLSHHGHVPESIDLLVQIERYQVEQFALFLDRLKAIKEPNWHGSLLDNSITLFGSGMGNANSHTNHNLPVIVAGGGFQHGEHKAYPEANSQRVPLCNLFVSLLQQFGVETDRFSGSTGTLRNFESV